MIGIAINKIVWRNLILAWLAGYENAIYVDLHHIDINNKKTKLWIFY